MLHVIGGLQPGGAETVLFRLATVGSPVEHEVICLTGRDWYSPLLEERGIRVHHLNMTSLLKSIIGFPSLRQLIRESRADVVQCWMYRSNLVAGIFARMSSLPVVWNIRCSTPQFLPLTSRLWAYAGGRLAAYIPKVVVNCAQRSAELHAELGYSIGKVRVIPNGYDSGHFFPDDDTRARTRQALGLGTAFVIGSVARWDPYKDIPGLLAALKLTRTRGMECKCVLIGRGLDPENPSLTSCIRNFGCEDQVLTLGKRDDLFDLARAIDLHVLASQSEGFPNVVAETMLSGTPNVVTDVGDSALIVGDSGWVVPAGDAEQLADSIGAAFTEWNSRPEHWEKRRQAARQRIAETFTVDRMAKAYEVAWTLAAQ